jgi:hypothetical protein
MPLPLDRDHMLPRVEGVLAEPCIDAAIEDLPATATAVAAPALMEQVLPAPAAPAQQVRLIEHVPVIVREKEAAAQVLEAAAPVPDVPARPERGRRSTRSTPPKPVQEPVQPAAGKKRKPRKPVQDEWGFFDPQQCGFAALLARLDELAEEETASATVGQP